MSWKAKRRQPTTEKLAQALEAAGAPADLVHRARAGDFDDYKSELAMPITALVQEARRLGLDDIAERAEAGDFDAQGWEAEAWAQSPEGREVFRQLGRRP
jgi:hypothetical protein